MPKAGGGSVPKLPKRWDFHAPKTHLTRGQKYALQHEMSTMTKKMIRQQIKVLKDMEKEKLVIAEKYDKKKIVTEEEEKRVQDAFGWAFYCREAAKFAEYYLKSLEWQKKI